MRSTGILQLSNNKVMYIDRYMVLMTVLRRTGRHIQVDII